MSRVLVCRLWMWLGGFVGSRPSGCGLEGCDACRNGCRERGLGMGMGEERWMDGDVCGVVGMTLWDGRGGCGEMEITAGYDSLLGYFMLHVLKKTRLLEIVEICGKKLLRSYFFTIPLG